MWQHVEREFLRYGVKESTADTYMRGLRYFCRFVNERYPTVVDAKFSPYNFAACGLDLIEDLTADFIADNRHKLSPKYLNVVFSAVKRWCYIRKLVKSAKLFREIRFDKSSRKTRDRMMLTRAIVKKLFDNANLKEKAVLGFYAINGLRPSLIPQLRIEDIYPEDVTLNADSVELKEKAWILIKSEYNGNKARIDFPIILTHEQSAWLEEYLNRRIRNGEKLTLKSKVVLVDRRVQIDYIVRKLYAAVGFEGRCYLLRHHAFKQLKRACDDYDLREWLMGHKGRISAIYDHGHYLTREEIDEYKALIHVQILHIYGLDRSEETGIETRIETIRALLEDLDTRQLKQIKNELTSGTLTIAKFNERLTRLARETMDRQIEAKFEQLFLKMQKKHNNGACRA